MNTKEMRLEQLLPVIQAQLAEGKSVRFQPRGKSMLPMLREGVDSVRISPVLGKLKKYDLPLYIRDNGKFVLHRIVQAGDTYTAIGDNQFEYERGLRHDQMVAVVTMFYRGEKEIPIDHPLYKLYCRLWHVSRPARHFARRAVGKIRRILHK